jgi:hypothetical protein
VQQAIMLTDALDLRHPLTVDFVPGFLALVLGALAIGIYLSLHFGKDRPMRPSCHRGRAWPCPIRAAVVVPPDTATAPATELNNREGRLVEVAGSPSSHCTGTTLSRTPQPRRSRAARAGLGRWEVFNLRSCRRVCRRLGSRRAEAQRNRSPRCLRGTMPRAQYLPE